MPLRQLSQPFSFNSLYAPVMLPAVLSLLDDLNHMANVGDAFALGDQLLSGFEFADDLLGLAAKGLSFILDRPQVPR